MLSKGVQEATDAFGLRDNALSGDGRSSGIEFPPNLRICQRGEWNVRMVVETVLSMLTYICDFKHARHKVWEYFKTKLGFTMALFNMLVQWKGFQPDEDGFVSLSIAEFSL